MLDRFTALFQERTPGVDEAFFTRERKLNGRELINDVRSNLRKPDTTLEHFSDLLDNINLIPTAYEIRGYEDIVMLTGKRVTTVDNEPKGRMGNRTYFIDGGLFLLTQDFFGSTEAVVAHHFLKRWPPIVEGQVRFVKISVERQIQALFSDSYSSKSQNIFLPHTRNDYMDRRKTWKHGWKVFFIKLSPDFKLVPDQPRYNGDPPGIYLPEGDNISVSIVRVSEPDETIWPII